MAFITLMAAAELSNGCGMINLARMIQRRPARSDMTACGPFVVFRMLFKKGSYGSE
jgi:hypothetical protein